MEKISFRQVSSLDKIFLDQPDNIEELEKISALKNERVSYQIAYRGNEIYFNDNVTIQVCSPLKKQIAIYEVGNVPVEFPFRGGHDAHFERTTPGLYPDVLYPIEGDCITITWRNWHSLWIKVALDGSIGAGVYPIDIHFNCGDFSTTKHMELEVIGADLHEQTLQFTQWLHADCIADYYKIPVFSERHWQLIDEYIKTATENGINMLLTPIITPPLDTAWGGARTTIQLVDIVKEGSAYRFNFDKLERWINIGKKHGIAYFEMAHLFTQWGAWATPKIIATVDGVEKQIFGWDVASASPEYKEFLTVFLPSLYQFLKDQGITDRTFFHISDEPQSEHLEHYLALKKMVQDILPEAKLMEACSSYDLFKTCEMSFAIPAVDHIRPFIENGVDNLWTYYCCDQEIVVPNRFIAMPSYRNRVIATQLYKYDIKGFLHWGFNFYNSALSRRKINPFVNTDADNTFPSGDAFSVYPGENGCLMSIRLLVFYEALQDLRAFQLLEGFVGKEAVVRLMEDTAGMEIHFDQYPHNKQFLLNLREKVNMEIKKHL